MSLLTRLLNAAGLHTQAELDAARAQGRSDRSARAGQESQAGRTESGASGSDAAPADSPVARILRSIELDLPELSVALQSQVKAQGVAKLMKLRDKGELSAEEFERWKRRILSL